MIGIGLSGIVLLIQNDPWSIVGFVLSVIAGLLLLLGTIKQKKMAIIIYLVLEMTQIIEMLIFTIMTLVSLANKNFECRCDSHECEDDVTFCEMVGTILGSVSGVDVLISIYFWLCVLSLFRTMSAEETMISVF